MVVAEVPHYSERAAKTPEGKAGHAEARKRGGHSASADSRVYRWTIEESRSYRNCIVACHLTHGRTLTDDCWNALLSTLTVTPPPAEPSGKHSDRVVLRNVPWEYYARLRDDEANRHLRMSYFKGALELMSPRYRHERSAARLGQFVMKLAEVLDIPCSESRSTTFRREDEGAGKEADTSFYLAHEQEIRDKDEIDLATDPPPDLAIEVDDFSNSRNKLAIYAALRVPEVWRYDANAGSLWFGRLESDGTYRSLDRSECLPMLTPEKVLEALALCRGLPESRWGRLLRDWIAGLPK
jgi:Uma2 family endonuclease